MSGNKTPAGWSNAAQLETKFRRGSPVRLIPSNRMFKNINWKKIGTIVVVALVVVVTAPIWLPPVKSLASKIPFLGPRLA